MRLADLALRRGHLSEDALIDVWSSGSRPAHLEHCDQCADRALEMSRWLEDVQAMGRADADDVFPEIRLENQRDQILNRLAQLDRPSKVISFPAASAAARQPFAAQRVSPGWLAAAAAAGLMIGVVSMELSHMVSFGDTVAPAVATAPVTPYDDTDLFDNMYDRPELGSLLALDEMTPRIADVVMVSSSRPR
jgi:hypothetical protein